MIRVATCGRIRPMMLFGTLGALLAGTPALGQSGQSPATAPPIPHLAAPYADPLAFTGDDPLMAYIARGGGEAVLGEAVAAAVARSPRVDEAEARLLASARAVDEAVEARLPVIEIGLIHDRSIISSFGPSTPNVIERLRPTERTNATFNANQTLWDFGAGADRARAARARRSASGEEILTTRNSVALQTVEAWYRIFGYRTLVRLGEAFLAEQRVTRGQLEDRVRQGVLAEGDLARMDSSIAGAEARQADYIRQLASAEARYAELVRAPVPADTPRARPPRMAAASREAAEAAALRLPEIKAAEAAAAGARLDARATRRDNLPRVTGTLDYGQYGVLENQADYELRGQVQLRQRLFGGTGARAARAEADAEEARARFVRVRDEAVSGAAIAWADVAALNSSVDALARNYDASRQARDVLFERFRVARGDLFSLVDAQENFFGVAARYIQTVIEHDVARYRLAERTGELEAVLGMPITVAPRHRAKERY